MMQEYIISWIDSSHQPQSLKILADHAGQYLNLSEEIPSIPIGTKLSCYEVTSTHDAAELYDDFSYRGILEEGATIRLISEPQQSIPLLTRLQRRIPAGNQYIQSYNEKLAVKVLEECNQAKLSTNVGAVYETEKVSLDYKDGVISVSDISRLHFKRFEYTTLVMLEIEYQDKPYFIECRHLTTVNTSQSTCIQLVPVEFSYGNRRSLETYHYPTKQSTFKLILQSYFKSLKYWFIALRTPQYLITLTSVFLAFSIVWSHSSSFDIGRAVLILIGLYLIQSGGNLLNDYFDHQSQLDEINIIDTSSNSERFIQNRLISPFLVLSTGLIFFIIGSAIGLYLDVTSRNQVVLLLGIIGGLITYFYTGEPLKLAYRGVGEVLLAMNFGPFIIIGSYYVMTDQLLPVDYLISMALPSLLFITAILLVNEIDDIEADQLVGKNTTAVRVGRFVTLLLSLSLVSSALLLGSLLLPLSRLLSGYRLIYFLPLLIILNEYWLVSQQKLSLPRLQRLGLGYLCWGVVTILLLQIK